MTPFGLSSGNVALLSSACAALLAAQTGCRDSLSQAAPDAGVVTVPEPIVVRDDDPSLLFSYRTPDGSYRTATGVDEVPESSRDAVVVMDLDKSPEERRSGNFVHVADLRKTKDDGTYPVAVQSRYAFEAPSSAGAEASPSKDKVVVYSASWCGVCKKTMHLLSSWEVPFVEKDVEASRSAANELAAKAARSGFTPGGVPVIDVDGILLRGLDEARLKATLQAQGLL